MNLPDITNGFIFLLVVIAAFGYGIIRALEWAISNISITIG